MGTKGLYAWMTHRPTLSSNMTSGIIGRFHITRNNCTRLSSFAPSFLRCKPGNFDSTTRKQPKNGNGHRCCRTHDDSSLRSSLYAENIAACAHSHVSDSCGACNAVYVHLPFCKKRCHYCDFSIVATGEHRRDHWEVSMDEYVATVCREIRATQVRERAPLSSIFFGGGTPSLVPPAMVARIMEALDHTFTISPTAEVSMEMDPGTFDENQLIDTLRLGVNRVSLGVQSFDQEMLERCGRSHGLDQVRAALELMHKHSHNWSLDLISSLPYQTLDGWEHSLRSAVEAAPHHISIYDLQVEPGTKFGRLYRPGDAPLPSDDVSAEMYSMGSTILTAAGYDHYEVSNYAKPGKQCAHNLVYWRNQDYYAFGMAAASHVDKVRYTRPTSLVKYTQWVEQFVASGGAQTNQPASEKEDELLDTLMLGLRLAEGLCVDQLRSRFGDETIERILCSLKSQGPAKVLFLDDAGELVPEEKNNSSIKRIRLTDPEGFMLSNDIISTIFAVLDSEVDYA